MFAQCLYGVVILSTLLLAYATSTPAVGREKRAIPRPDVYRCRNHIRELILRKNRGKYNEDTYELGEILEAECKVVAKDSSTTYRNSIYLDDELLEPVQSDDPQKRKVSRVLAVSDNGKRLRCVVSDDKGETEFPEMSREIKVYFSPQPQPQEDVDRCGYKVGENAAIDVNVYANPRPNFSWSANPDKYVKGSRTYDKSNRFHIHSTEDLGNGHWLVKLNIDELRQSDFERFYYLQASNELGSNSYVVFIKIHCDEEQRSNFLANGI